MSKTHRRIAGIIVLAVLAALAAWQWQHDRAAAPGTLLDLDPAAVTRIRLERPGRQPERYVRRDGHWWTHGPDPVRADDGRLDDIAALAAAPVQRWRPDTGFDLGKLGLDPPQLSLYLDGRRIDYGVLSPFGPQRYVHVGARIGLVAATDSPRAAHAIHPGTQP